MPGMEALLRSGWRASLRRRAAQGRPTTAAEHLRAKPVQAVASQPPIRGWREGRQEGDRRSRGAAHVALALQLSLAALQVELFAAVDRMPMQMYW